MLSLDLDTFRFLKNVDELMRYWCTFIAQFTKTTADTGKMHMHLSGVTCKIFESVHQQVYKLLSSF